MSRLQRLIDYALRLLQLDAVPEVSQDGQPKQSEPVEEAERSAISDPGMEIQMSALVDETRENLHIAIQEHLNALGSDGLLCDWYVATEVLDSNDNRNMSFAFSGGLSPWKLRGLAYYSSELLENFTS